MTDVIALHTKRPPLRAIGSPVRAEHTAKALGTALGMLTAFEIPECSVVVHDNGQVIHFDFSRNPHPIGDVRYACNAFGMLLEERPVDLPDGTAGMEVYGNDYLDGILRVVSATVPVPAVWPVVP